PQLTGSYPIFLLMARCHLFSCYYEDWFFLGAQDEALRRVIYYNLTVVWLRHAGGSAETG
ncbi:hypothetical protein, partial [Serratia plymuthica]|uniref:hypothetical protein n=1 Tax=Serratia plymuthica TaxID=82996 RepID=UPI001BAE811F